MPIIDTHNHIYFPGLETETVIKAAQKVGVGRQVLIGIDELSCLQVINLIKKYEDLYGTLGLHPCDVDQLGRRNEFQDYPGAGNYTFKCHTLPEYFQWIETLYSQNSDPIVGFGETGFDRYHRDTPTLVKLQEESFESHLELCVKHQKTCIIHCRKATQNCLNFMKKQAHKFKSINFIWHCFDEDLNTAKAVIDLGGKIGIGGIITYPKSETLREVVKAIPLQSLVTETDAPFLTPYQARKKHTKNSPEFLPEIITTIAQITQQNPRDCADRLYQNGCEIFNLKNGD